MVSSWEAIEKWLCETLIRPIAQWHCAMHQQTPWNRIADNLLLLWLIKSWLHYIVASLITELAAHNVLEWLCLGMITETVDAESDSEEHVSAIHVSPSKITIDCQHTVESFFRAAIFGYRRSSRPFGRAESVPSPAWTFLSCGSQPVGQWAWQQFSFLSYKARFFLETFISIDTFH